MKISEKFVCGYNVKYKERDAVDSGVIIQVGKVEKTLLSNLKKFTEYTVQVAARSSQPGNYSKILSAKTFEHGKLPLLHIFKCETFY